ncbi:RnfH family protein [Thiomicrorhabdus sp. 6S3-12]|uniref:RnfH family protein n=1 Tax=Thiomicrorhabdus sp. 6S3-12 TaxID=2819681 RepID=UPI001AACE029|nr:RnfH family protein [Thiomicrorhabdus sp. 6S3-12]
MKIEIAYALPDEQFLYEQDVPEGSTVLEALQVSELLRRFPELDIEKVGIFGKPVKHDQILREGDRIEVYRPLKADPRERRREKVTKERDGKLK